MTTCNNCNNQIPDGATFCQNCGAKIGGLDKLTPAKNKKPIFKKWWFWVIAIIVLIAIVSNLNQDGSKITTTTAPGENTQSQNSVEKKDSKKDEKKDEEMAEEVTINKPGEGIETKNFKVSVEAVKKPKGNEFNKPAEGKEFVEVVVLIENISKKDYNISSMLMFNAYQDGFSVNESLMAQTADTDIKTLDGALAAGKKLRGKLAYELPKDWKELEINADLTKLSFSTDGKVKMVLKNEPTK